MITCREGKISEQKGRKKKKRKNNSSAGGEKGRAVNSTLRREGGR